jgi:hypothetical protein
VEVRSFRIASPNIIRETFDDEAVIVNLDSGAYYSLQGAAAVIWTLLERGCSESAIGGRLIQQYTGEPGEIQQQCRAFLQQLIDERLVIAAADAGAELPEASGPVKPFEAPALAKFSDMQELLLLDPIHETDETGWPARKP